MYEIHLIIIYIFQSKTEESPGFLPKDKIKDHLKKAQRIRDKQDAIKILEMAGIEVDSPAAEEILRDANVSADVIAVYIYLLMYTYLYGCIYL
jgi:hypothetical protein